ncbi:hypothetical protein ISN44_As13g003950 [Arabidopsis suecica]|uniref:Uncharacterized protein n=1 Tax=Arabidopsis suecica TaxID=45249 RepID=A0A8T1XQX5_ARASU|nr:hypothetical protein ISN44_As13g003950 [Arabidopsis suecica]
MCPLNMRLVFLLLLVLLLSCSHDCALASSQELRPSSGWRRMMRRVKSSKSGHGLGGGGAGDGRGVYHLPLPSPPPPFLPPSRLPSPSIPPPPEALSLP